MRTTALAAAAGPPLRVYLGVAMVVIVIRIVQGAATH
jgi:hypothetical protein